MVGLGEIGFERHSSATDSRCGRTDGKSNSIVFECFSIIGRKRRSLQSKYEEEMEAVASTGLYPPAPKSQVGSEVDAKYGLMHLAARAATPATAGPSVANRASFPQTDPQQQLIYRGLNNARSTPYGQVMSYAGVPRPYESPQIPKRDELGKASIVERCA